MKTIKILTLFFLTIFLLNSCKKENEIEEWQEIEVIWDAEDNIIIIDNQTFQNITFQYNSEYGFNVINPGNDEFNFILNRDYILKITSEKYDLKNAIELNNWFEFMNSEKGEIYLIENPSCVKGVLYYEDWFRFKITYKRK